MNKTKHTRGPWLQNYISQASTNEVKAEGKRIALVLQYDEKQNRVADFDTCNANAKLIAAAPELLEALAEVAKCKRGEGLPVETIIKMMAALDKAVPYSEDIEPLK